MENDIFVDPLTNDRLQAACSPEVSHFSNAKRTFETTQDSPSPFHIEPRSLFGSFAATMRRSLFAGAEYDDDIDEYTSGDVITQSRSLQQIHGDHDYYVVAHRPEPEAVRSTRPLTCNYSSRSDEVGADATQSMASSADVSSPSLVACRGPQRSERTRPFQEVTSGSVLPRRAASFCLVSASSSCDSTRSCGPRTPALTPRSLGIGGFNTLSGLVTISEIASRPHHSTTSLNVEPSNGLKSSSLRSLDERADTGSSFSQLAVGEATVGSDGSIRVTSVARQQQQRVIEYRLKARQSFPDDSSAVESTVLSASIGRASLPTRMRKKRVAKTPTTTRPRSGTNDLSYSTLVHRIAVSRDSESTQRQQHQQPLSTSTASFGGGCGVISSSSSLRRPSSIESLIERQIIDCSVSKGSGTHRHTAVEASAAAANNAVGSSSQHHFSSGSSSSSTRGNQLQDKFRRLHPLQLSLPTPPPGLPSPFLLQTGLEKALDFAEFQPMSPSSGSSSSPIRSPLQRDKLITTNVDAGNDSLHRAKHSARYNTDPRAKCGTGARHRPCNDDVIVDETRFDGKISSGKVETNASATVGDNKYTKSFDQESGLFVTPAAMTGDIIYGDVNDSPLLTGNIDIDGCYWDGLLGDEEQIDHWQTTIWNGGCNAEDTTWFPPPPTRPEKAPSSAGVNPKCTSDVTAPSSTSTENSERRKRRTSSSTKNGFNRNHTDGSIVEKRKRCKLASSGGLGHLKPTEVISSPVSQQLVDGGKGARLIETGKPIGSAQQTHCSGNVASSSSLPKHSNRKRKESSSGGQDKSPETGSFDKFSRHPADQPHDALEVDKPEKLFVMTSAQSDDAASMLAYESLSSSSRHHHHHHRRRRRFSAILSTGSGELEKPCGSRDDDLAAVSQSQSDEVRVDLKSNADSSSRSTTLTDACSSKSSRRTKRFTSSRSSKSSKRTSTDDTAAAKTGRSSHHSSSFCSKVADSAGGHCWSSRRQGCCVAPRASSDKGGDNDAGIAGVFDDLLAGWDRYLALDEAQMLEYELENAKHFRYSKGATAMVGNRELEVWRIVDQMKCKDYLI